MKSAELRESFLEYFEKNDHKRVASSSLVPLNDPTLFFVNAGMVQFKDLFLGNERRDYKRAATSQKCMRVSGKHNDLENVGHTPRHHTFFEMLGNFSFGDYFKKEAIAYGWEFLTKTVGLPKDRLYITIYNDDDEAEKLWKKHVSKDRIHRLGEKDNFWSMGDTGPCGPCSEIHFDRDPAGKVKTADFETDRFMEIWNLVFMQFNRTADGKMEKLKKPSIDTGMGLERLAAVVAGVPGNYETDLFMPVIGQVEKISGHKYKPEYSDGAGSSVSMRVIADHIRSMVFLIGDGVQPSNEGRGYVLRRIIRRAARHGKLLKIKSPFFVPLAHTIIDQMGSTYNELALHREFIEKVIFNEEERFNDTLEKGLEILEASFRELKKNGSKVLSGEEAFKLYDTYGFPKDLTEDIAADAGFKVDSEGFENAMNKQREKARSAWKGSGEEAVSGIYKELKNKGVKSAFIGYEEMSTSSKLVALLKDNREVSNAKEGDDIFFVTDETPFYGASGGQVGDTGMAVADGIEVEIMDTVKPFTDMTVHHGVVKKGNIKKGDVLTLAIDSDRRSDIAKNHTATHLLHRALRKILGEHVKQAGSYVGPDRFRFDFSHFQGMKKEELLEAEMEVNRAIRSNMPVTKEELPYDAAVAKGAMAFFGDKYGDIVRMVSVDDYSRELCGGCHIDSTGEIGFFKITGESSVAAGVRRIEGVTGFGAENYVQEIESSLFGLAEALKVGVDEVAVRFEKIISENKNLKRDIETAKAKLLAGSSGNSGADVENISGIKLSAKLAKGVAPKELRTVADTIKNKIGSGIVMLASENDGKTSILIAVTDDLSGKYKAGNLMKEIVSSIGGTGGGRPDMAQGGAPVTGKFDELKSSLVSLIKNA